MEQPKIQITERLLDYRTKGHIWRAGLSVAPNKNLVVGL